MSLAKMMFFGTTCSCASAVGIGPIQEVHGKVPGSVRLTIYSIGMRLTADFHTSKEEILQVCIIDQSPYLVWLGVECNICDELFDKNTF